MNLLAKMAKTAVHAMYDLTAKQAVKSELHEAINLWRNCLAFCDETLGTIKESQELQTNAELNETFHEVLAYRNESKRRFDENSAELTFRDVPIPNGFFTKDQKDQKGQGPIVKAHG